MPPPSGTPWAPRPSTRGRAEGRALIRGTAVLALVAALAALGLHAGREIQSAPVRAAGSEVPVYLPRAEFLRLISLGFRNAMADALWFRTINYFGLHYRSDRLYPWMARMCDVVTDLDPRAHHVYRFAGVILPWEAGLPDDGIRLLEKGLRVFPDSWILHYILGFNYFFFKGDTAGALPHVQRAAELPGAHPFVARFAGMLLSEQLGREAARDFLQDLARSPDAGDFRSVLQEHINDLRLAEDIERLESAIAAFRERRGRLPSGLEELVASGFIDAIPREPFGGEYRYDAGSGSVGSRLGRKPLRLYTSAMRSKARRGEQVRD